jgi:hypothetical protein
MATTFLPASQVQKALDDWDRGTPMGRRDYAILMMLAKLGLRADEVAPKPLPEGIAITPHLQAAELYKCLSTAIPGRSASSPKGST